MHLSGTVKKSGEKTYPMLTDALPALQELNIQARVDEQEQMKREQCVRETMERPSGAIGFKIINISTTTIRTNKINAPRAATEKDRQCV